MTFSDTEHHSQIEPSAEEMLRISEEISLKFSPSAVSIADMDSFSADDRIGTNLPQTTEDIADDYSIDSCYGGFSPKELQEIGEEISRNFAPQPSAVVPELFLLPVDPHHLYAYWETGEDDILNPLTLRIYWRPDANPDIISSNVWFDIAADNPGDRRKIRLPIDDTAYSAVLGKLNPDSSFEVLASSNIIQVPPAPGRTRIAPFRRNQEQLLLVSDTPAVVDRTQAIHEEKPFFENPIFAPEMKGILYEKPKEGAHFPEPGWFVKLHFGHQTELAGDTEIESELMDIFKTKGIFVELIPEGGFIEASPVLGKNASGQGI